MLSLDDAIKHCEEKAKEVREQVATHMVVDAEEIGDCIECAKEHEQLAEWLKELKALREGKWILVSERLPEDMQRVLIWFEYYRYGDFNCMYQTYGFGYVLDGKWSPFINGETGWQDYNIIAWQPLPEPYKKEGAE